MEKFPILVTDPLWGESSVYFPHKRPVMRNFDVFFVLSLTKLLNEQFSRRLLNALGLCHRIVMILPQNYTLDLWIRILISVGN